MDIVLAFVDEGWFYRKQSRPRGISHLDKAFLVISRCPFLF